MLCCVHVWGCDDGGLTTGRAVVDRDVSGYQSINQSIGKTEKKGHHTSAVSLPPLSGTLPHAPPRKRFPRPARLLVLRGTRLSLAAAYISCDGDGHWKLFQSGASRLLYPTGFHPLGRIDEHFNSDSGIMISIMDRCLARCMHAALHRERKNQPEQRETHCGSGMLYCKQEPTHRCDRYYYGIVFYLCCGRMTWSLPSQSSSSSSLQIYTILPAYFHHHRQSRQKTGAGINK
ncbi:uncharacterized protein K489DRAFT_260466 [Dissoconium aciculare CBS 342.82]|uniref:Uncharacterized protein n=1 Tax=Dissoconium aciculare CBS 342.82 TaxID=1314786 RepID=A0A6J3LYT5_9PEZI|nr:uncharacterized protein K489DRAFT_260466 [Dissoconium aciculare CBS 342.82]KAF1820921.1 hypothetical protein K489DRAFT_260466 [Dissoconium aciculare CBS 342.82]